MKTALLAMLLSLGAGADELARLEGHEVRAKGSGYEIADVAGEGRPLVGTVRRRGDQLELEVAPDQRFVLTGPLARPRIAGPGYRVWVLGEVTPRGHLRARRLGVLAPPPR